MLLMLNNIFFWVPVFGNPRCGRLEKAIGLTTTLRVHHSLLNISLPSLHDFEVKVPNFTFSGGRKHKTTTLHLFSWTLILKKITNISRTGRDGTSAMKSARFNFLYRAFSYDVTAAILLFQNNGTAAMLVYQDNPVGVELFSYVKTFFCSNKLAYVLAMWVKTLCKGLFTWRWGTPGRWGNPPRWGNQSYNPAISGYTFSRLLNGR